jgi:hypothetical protein
VAEHRCPQNLNSPSLTRSRACESIDLRRLLGKLARDPSLGGEIRRREPNVEDLIDADPR